MGKGLRRTSKISSNGSDTGDTLDQKKVNDGRNRLKNMVVGDLGLKKAPTTISSQLSS